MGALATHQLSDKIQALPLQIPSVLLPVGNVETMYQTQVPNKAMTVLAHLLEPVGRCFTPEVAQAVVDLRADPAIQARLEDLADKSTQGTLSEDERIEYETYVHAIDFIAVLQSQAHRIYESYPH